MISSKPKRKRCKVCNTLFTPFKSTEKVCSMTCAIAFAKTKEGKDYAKKERGKELLGRKRNLRENNRSWWVKEAQKAFNKYIRTRDEDKPCITCGRMNPPCFPRKGQWDAGHYRTVGACPELRFEPDNCHKECVHDNLYNGDHLIHYRRNLIERIGLERVEWIEGPHEPKKYTIDDLREIRDHFKQLTKELESAAQVA